MIEKLEKIKDDLEKAINSINEFIDNFDEDIAMKDKIENFRIKSEKKEE